MSNGRILIGGDLVIVKDKSVTANLSDEVLALFKSSDLNILNVECPVTDLSDEFQISKTGPHLKGCGDSTLKVLKSLNVALVTLANNHILDYGETGLQHTLQFCEKNAIETVGAGMNTEDAHHVFRRVICGQQISILNFSENEWSNATPGFAGANPLYIPDNIRQIQQEKKIADKVIVIIHGGHEYYNLPSPRMQDQYRFYAENGADLIVGHHTHCINGFEIYKGTPIYYSLGNFLFTKKSRYEDWFKGLILEITFSAEGLLQTRLIPIQTTKETYNLSLSKGEEKEVVLERIESYNKIIADSDLLQKRWQSFVSEKHKQYKNSFSPIRSLFPGRLKNVLIKFGLDDIFVNKNHFKLMYNLIRCEAHLDATKEMFKKIYNDSNTQRSRK